MNSHIKQLSDHFIIGGFGRIGQTVGERLRDSEIPFIVVDPNLEQVEKAVSLDYLAIQGNSAEDDVLLLAGIERARGVICVTNSDAENVFVTLSARGLNPGLFIAARASTEGAANKMRRAGATLVVSPYTSAGHRITDAILRPNMRDILTDDRASDLDLSVLRIDDETIFLEKSIAQIAEDFPQVIVVAINSLRDGKIFRPDRDRRFELGDQVTVAGRNSDLDQIHRVADQRVSSIQA